VNSPVRAFRAVGGHPPFAARGEGATLTDEDGVRRLDFVGSWGALLLGHAPPPVVAAAIEAVRTGSSFGAPTAREVEWAERLCARLPWVERVRLCSSGSEATAHALRLARGATGRDLVIKFDGCYHGAHDAVLVGAGSGGLTLGVPDSAGVPRAVAALTRVLPYNDVAAVDRCFAQEGDAIAAVIVEPVAGNMGTVAPRPGFLEALRERTTASGALLVVDEVMTGFRVGPQGAQGRYGVIGDLTCLGKIVGGGFPLAAFGGRADLMDRLAPLGPVYQAGTLSGNPVAVAAGIATLDLLDDAVYARVEEIGRALEEGLAAPLRAAGASMSRVGGMFTIWFRPTPPNDLAEAKTCDTGAFARFFGAALDAGLYLPPSQFEAAFLSAAMTSADAAFAVDGFARALALAR
jgi:glutamate-1-semialdehyde 2,1-aminomutase